MVVGACVHGGAVDQEAKRSGEVLSCALASFVFLGESPVDVGETGADAILVPFECVQVDGISEVGCEQFVALVLESLAVGREFCDLRRLRGEPFVERYLDLCREGGVLLFGDGDVSVAVRDQLLGDADGHGPPGAVLPFGGPPGADVVGVAHALAVGREVELHPRSAGAAEQRPFEVVVVGAASFGSKLAGVQKALHSFPDLDVDQWFMRAGVFCAFVADDADVVGVAEHREEPRAGYRLRRSARSRQRSQPTGGDVVEQLDHGAVTGGVLFEDPADHGAAFGVDLDGAVLAALLVTFADVEIADRRPHRGSAGRDFLRQALHNLVREVLGVELRDGGHDAVQQHP
nr:hypothetical protein [Tessaracoccus bendigoensis]